VTDRFIPPSVGSLRPFVDAGVLGLAEVHVVATLVESVLRSVPAGRRGDDVVDGSITDDVVLAAALAVRAPLHGHVRVDLTEVAATVVPIESRSGSPAGSSAGSFEGPDPDGPAGHDEGVAPDNLFEQPSADAAPVDLSWPDPDVWVQRVLSSPLARDESDGRGEVVEPLVVSGTSIYLDRWWCDEIAVAEDLRARAGAASPVDASRMEALDRFLPEASDGREDRQRAAVLAALERQLVVIAGGPGTGKTRTVARLLAVLASDGTVDPAEDPASGVRLPEIALAAPTGKAAARLEEAIGAAVREADPGDEVAGRLGSLEARTLHRLLGARRSDASYTHDSSNPIPADVVVVDEVSMVSLPLMARLLDAVRPEARVVLVGDPYQLASVEAGAVLGDLVGRRAEAAPAALRDNVVVLERVYRFGAGSPVGRLASAIKAGDVDAVLDELHAGGAVPGSDGVVRRVDPAFDEALDEVRALVLDHAVRLVDSARAARTDEVLGALGDLKVLCATGRGPLGVEDWNASIEAELRSGGRMRERWSAGRPVMVTANDYVNGVFNGDVGVVVRRDPAARGPGSVRVAFDGAAGPRLLDPARLDRVTTQWAMTIHKSQGSEFTDVVVTLPPPPSPILTRELLYTAVTRARSGVTLVASEASVRAAVERPVARASGLADRLG